MNKQASKLASILSESGKVPERRSLSAEAADALRELILLEKLAPGTPVPERDLAEGLGISRTPLKDALRILETEGLVEYGPTRRPRVADPSLEEIEQNITVLSALEALAGELACVQATAAQITEIQALDHRMRTMPAKSSTLEFFHLDMDFHSSIVAASGNEPLAATHKQYNARLWRARFMSSRQRDRRDNTLAEHGAITQALAARDAATTAAELRRHLASTIVNLRHIRTPDAET
jgi:DNA-binding GntR family transcriptional regulator